MTDGIEIPDEVEVFSPVEGEDFIVIQDPLAESDAEEQHDWAVLVEKGEYKGLIARYRDIQLQGEHIEFTYELLYWEGKDDEVEFDQAILGRFLADVLNVVVAESLKQRAADVHDMETGEYIEY